MDPKDENNLQFLLRLRTYEQWQAWAQKCSVEDFAYALRLLNTEISRTMITDMEFKEELEAEEGMDLTEANNVLARFRLKPLSQ